jgi:hypothetical protein
MGALIIPHLSLSPQIKAKDSLSGSLFSSPTILVALIPPPSGDNTIATTHGCIPQVVTVVSFVKPPLSLSPGSGVSTVITTQVKHENQLPPTEQGATFLV